MPGVLFMLFAGSNQSSSSEALPSGCVTSQVHRVFPFSFGPSLLPYGPLLHWQCPPFSLCSALVCGISEWCMSSHPFTCRMELHEKRKQLEKQRQAEQVCVQCDFISLVLCYSLTTITLSSLWMKQEKDALRASQRQALSTSRSSLGGTGSDVGATGSSSGQFSARSSSVPSKRPEWEGEYLLPTCTLFLEFIVFIISHTHTQFRFP